MEYIDKKILETEGEAIIQSFLERLKVEGNPYPQDLYKKFGKLKLDKITGGYKKNLKQLLLTEQNHYCCYCMQKFGLDPKDEVTLEHHILNRITKQEDFDKYLLKDTILKDKVCLASEFINNQETNTPPYPHTVAYQNLTASCNGMFLSRSRTATHCNLKRGKQYVEPLPLYATIKEEIEYNKDSGMALWVNEKEESIILNILGLNDDLLLMIRKIWFYSIKKEIKILEIDTAQQEDFLRSFQEFILDNELDMLSNFINNVTYWNLLKRYEYFGESPNVK